MNATIEKFGYPASVVREFGHWLVLARPAQVTLGSIVLAAKGEATAFGELRPEAFAELGVAVAAIERGLAAFCGYQRINYLMLMMVDPHVHFHVIPRYSGKRAGAGLELADHGWPGPPDLASATALSSVQLGALRDALARHL